jgi:hypothetical protein
MANSIDIYHLMMYRKYFTSEIPNTGDIKNDVDMLLNNSSGSARFWRQSSTHSMIFSGITVGGMIFDLWKYGIDYMNNDKIRFA